MLALAEEGTLDDWALDVARLAPTADLVAQVIRERYPTLEVPFHARWRHFVFNGRDLWGEVASATKWPNAAARARSAFDLAITSVLLDAGAGPAWAYRDSATGITASRSEGLALASLRWFAGGGVSTDAREPLRADAAALRTIDTAALNAAFQVSTANPLVGLPGRAELLNRLGEAIQRQPDLFSLSDAPRPGGLFDALAQRASGGRLPAALILEVLLDAFGTIWHGRPALDGVPLGDCWVHPALDGPSPADRYAPLHKLSQWLTYSLIEPLTAGGDRGPFNRWPHRSRRISQRRSLRRHGRPRAA